MASLLVRGSAPPNPSICRGSGLPKAANSVRVLNSESEGRSESRKNRPLLVPPLIRVHETPTSLIHFSAEAASSLHNSPLELSEKQRSGQCGASKTRTGRPCCPGHRRGREKRMSRSRNDDVKDRSNCPYLDSFPKIQVSGSECSPGSGSSPRKHNAQAIVGYEHGHRSRVKSPLYEHNFPESNGILCGGGKERFDRGYGDSNGS